MAVSSAETIRIRDLTRRESNPTACGREQTYPVSRARKAERRLGARAGSGIGMQFTVDRTSPYSGSQFRIQAIRIRNADPLNATSAGWHPFQDTGDGFNVATAPGESPPPGLARYPVTEPRVSVWCPIRSATTTERALRRPPECLIIRVIPHCAHANRHFRPWVANSNHSHLHVVRNSFDKAVPCTFVCATASPTDSSSKQPPSSLTGRRGGPAIRSRRRSRIGSARGSGAVHVENSLSTLSSRRRLGTCRWYCLIAHTCPSSAIHHRRGRATCHTDSSSYRARTPPCAGDGSPTGPSGNQAASVLPSREGAACVPGGRGHRWTPPSAGAAQSRPRSPGHRHSNGMEVRQTSPRRFIAWR